MQNIIVHKSFLHVTVGVVFESRWTVHLLYHLRTKKSAYQFCEQENDRNLKKVLHLPYMLDQRPLLYKGRTQIVASLASKMKHLVATLK